MTDHSVLLLAYGQSNADLYPAEPALPCEAFGDPRIVTFNDGHAFRGLMGKQRPAKAAALLSAEVAGNASMLTRNYQSFQVAAAARLLAGRELGGLRQVVIRSEGRGGRRFDGIINKRGVHQEGILTNVDGGDSQLLRNALDSIHLAAQLSARGGAPLKRVFVNFLHGEADRGNSAETYADGLRRLIDRFALELAQFGLPVDWLILDPAGTSSTGSGNSWPCRLAMREIATARANVHLIGAGYAYPLDDVIHYGSEARVLFGEHFGAAVAHLLARDNGVESDLGWLLDAPGPPQAVLKGATVDLHLPGNDDFDLIAGLSDVNLTVEGFSTSIAAHCQVTAASQTGPRSVRLELDKPPAQSERATLNYAYQVVLRQHTRSDSPMPAGRGGWRSVRALDSLVLPGRRIHQWVPGFSIPFAEMEQG
ncbi:hypothetical protein [uncultured Paracoccus sp.]|uniref:hypothetical protein n=1 Tax=uncultured Paracoccus sp. TaxID=189685 RepID=UPI00261DA0CB|nr:hypothetical protein [uncultured Paracoccus sp.]